MTQNIVSTSSLISDSAKVKNMTRRRVTAPTFKFGVDLALLDPKPS